MRLRWIAWTAVLCVAAAPLERRIDFEGDETGQAPRFFTSAATGDGREGKWVIEEVDGAPSGKRVLAQRDAKGGADRIALCLYDSPKVADIDVEVRLNPVAGDKDRSGGLAVRCIDRSNYYAVRADARSGDVRIYAVVQGRPTQLAVQPVAIDSNKWHRLRVVLSGRHIVVHFNDVKVLEIDDDAFRDPGNVAVWTQGDSAVQFDDFILRQVAKQ